MTSVSKRKRPPKQHAIGQRDRFIEAAKALDCDDDKERFEDRLKKIAKAKPKGDK